MIERYYDNQGNLRYNFYRKNGANYSTVEYRYHSRGLLAGVYDATNDNITMKAEYYYDANDNIVHTNYGNKKYGTYLYNAANLVVSMGLFNESDKARLEYLEYSYRPDGNITNKSELYNGYKTTTSYGYDAAGRLTYESFKDGDGETSFSYNYDTAGNRSSMTVSGYYVGYTENYSYDKNNRLISSVKLYNTACTEYTYDKNDNQIQIDRYTKIMKEYLNWIYMMLITIIITERKGLNITV